MFEIIADDLRNTLAMGILSMFLITSVFMANVKGVLICVLLVFMVDVCIYGSMWIWAVRVNAISVINLVMAAGLVIDYMVHFLHYYLLQANHLSPEVRLKRAMAEIGPTVSLGIATTFIGILPLLLAQSYVFRVFFYMFFDIIFYAFVHSYVLLPVLLLIFDPQSGKASAKVLKQQGTQLKNALKENKLGESLAESGKQVAQANPAKSNGSIHANGHKEVKIVPGSPGARSKSTEIVTEDDQVSVGGESFIKTV
jgi:predicted RND superfamily exporter protein